MVTILKGYLQSCWIVGRQTNNRQIDLHTELSDVIGDVIEASMLLFFIF